MFFGANAHLDVPGSFHASTADTVKFADGAEFDASSPAQSTFTTAQPNAFGFLDNTPAGLAVQDGKLQAPDGKTLSLSGGEVRIEQAQLSAPGGRLEVTGRQAITVRDSNLSSSGEGGGKVVIRGGRFELHSSLVHADTLGSVEGQGIEVEVASLQATGGSRLTSITTGPGKGGDIEFQAQGAVAFSGNETSAYGRLLAWSGNETHAEAGIGGAIDFSAGELALYDGAALETVTFGHARSGDIRARVAGRVQLGKEEGSLSDSSGISALTVGEGDAGDVLLEAGQVELFAGGTVWTAANPGSRGDGGDLTIRLSRMRAMPRCRPRKNCSARIRRKLRRPRKPSSVWKFSRKAAAAACRPRLPKPSTVPTR